MAPTAVRKWLIRLEQVCHAELFDALLKGEVDCAKDLPN